MPRSDAVYTFLLAGPRISQSLRLFFSISHSFTSFFLMIHTVESEVNKSGSFFHSYPFWRFACGVNNLPAQRRVPHQSDCTRSPRVFRATKSLIRIAFKQLLINCVFYSSNSSAARLRLRVYHRALLNPLPKPLIHPRTSNRCSIPPCSFRACSQSQVWRRKRYHSVRQRQLSV